MSTQPVTCAECREVIEHWQSQCRCGVLIGFPNFRSANDERDELANRYQDARDDCLKRGVEPLMSRFEALVEQSRPVIAMAYAVADDLLRPGKYRNYHQRILSGERNPANLENAAHREMVGAKLFPGYKENMQYAALSPDGRGLMNYGPVTLQWDVKKHYLGIRATLIEENSYMLFKRLGLGDPETPIPAGYRAIWEDRVKLAVAKHANRLTPATDESELVNLLISPADDFADDEFVEVVIYTEKGLDTVDVTMVTVQKSPKDRNESLRLEILREQCANLGISFVK